MIRRVYADNYRSLVNFEWRPGAETLVLGVNGSGKTTVLDVIGQLQSGLCGWVPFSDLFPPQELTAWTERRTMRFELDLDVEGLPYAYQLEVDCAHRNGKSTIRTESLRFGERLMFERDEASVRLMLPDGGDAGGFPLNGTTSVVLALNAVETRKPLATFVEALRRIVVVQPIPPLMLAEGQGESDRLSYDVANFVPWYRNAASDGRFASNVHERLQEIWPEFDSLNLDRTGSAARTLEIRFRPEAKGRPITLRLDQLSDGERMLVVLYALLSYQTTQSPTTLIIDEPDNFVGLPELQPWLLRLLDERPEEGQVILVSHNDRIIDTMGYESAALFTRADHLSPTRVTGIAPNGTGLALSQRLSRGWIDE